MELVHRLASRVTIAAYLLPLAIHPLVIPNATVDLNLHAGPLVVGRCYCFAQFFTQLFFYVTVSRSLHNCFYSAVPRSLRNCSFMQPLLVRLFKPVCAVIGATILVVL